MVTDGADTSDASHRRVARRRSRRERCRSSPVGVGQERLARDIQVTRVETPRARAQGHVARRRRRRHADGLRAARRCRSTSRTTGRIVSTQDVTLPADGESTTVHVHFTATEAGARAVPVPHSRRRPARRSRRTTRATRSSRSSTGSEKILYFEGEPRFEVKFIRRAVDDDKNLQVVLLQRTAEATRTRRDKYLRLGVDSADELVDGFPKTREELFALSRAHPRQRRGRAFTPRPAADDRRLRRPARRRAADARRPARRSPKAAGRGTPVADVLPVVLDRATQQPDSYRSPAHRDADARGRAHPVTQIAETEAGRRQAQVARPAAAHRGQPDPRRLKPGATVLLTGIDEKRPRAGRARLPALRPRQDAGVARSGLVAVADGREDGRRRHDARHVLAAAGALARRRRARSGRGHHRARSRASRASRSR